jgi:hypothetical protein
MKAFKYMCGWRCVHWISLGELKMYFKVKNNYDIHVSEHSLCLNFFHILAWKPNLEKNYIYSNKFCNNFHLSESSFTFPGASGKWVSVKTVNMN